jgi:hypothetical protein
MRARADGRDTSSLHPQKRLRAETYLQQSSLYATDLQGTSKLIADKIRTAHGNMNMTPKTVAFALN